MTTNRSQQNLTSSPAKPLSPSQRFTRYVADWIIHNSTLEQYFRSLCLQEKTRKVWRLGAIAYGCVHALKQPEIRRAEFPTYAMLVNIAEPLGIRAYFFQESVVPWFVDELVRPGDICLDIGANMGHYTFHMASKVGPEGKVVAFEPQPDYYNLIQDSIRLNDWHSFVITDSRAMWHSSGETLKFYLSNNPNNSGTSSLVNHGLFLEDDLTIQVDTVTLSDFSEEQGFDHYRLIKIDVERVEYQVLQGMTNLLASNSIDFIIMETSAGSKAASVLLGHGYCCYLIDPHRQAFTDQKNVSEGYFGDFLFVNSCCLSGFQRVFKLK